MSIELYNKMRFGEKIYIPEMTKVYLYSNYGVFFDKVYEDDVGVLSKISEESKHLGDELGFVFNKDLVLVYKYTNVRRIYERNNGKLLMECENTCDFENYTNINFTGVDVYIGVNNGDILVNLDENKLTKGVYKYLRYYLKTIYKNIDKFPNILFRITFYPTSNKGLIDPVQLFIRNMNNKTINIMYDYVDPRYLHEFLNRVSFSVFDNIPDIVPYMVSGTVLSKWIYVPFGKFKIKRVENKTIDNKEYLIITDKKDKEYNLNTIDWDGEIVEYNNYIGLGIKHSPHELTEMVIRNNKLDYIDVDTLKKDEIENIINKSEKIIGENIDYDKIIDNYDEKILTKVQMILERLMMNNY